MSGGSYNYAYQTVEEMGDDLTRDENPLLKAFGHQLILTSRAMKAVEWWKSGDSSKDRAVAAVKQAMIPLDPKIVESLKRISTGLVELLREDQ